MFGVIPGLHRQGIGRGLVEFVEEKVCCPVSVILTEIFIFQNNYAGEGHQCGRVLGKPRA
jgi:hypothetical protein